MNFFIHAIGFMRKNQPEEILVRDYLSKIKGRAEIREYEERKNLPIPWLKKNEAALLLKDLPEKVFVVALDEHGKQMDSVEFADLVQKVQNMGISKMAFLIGGAFGHGEEVKKRADILLSLGKMTFPHFLARAVLSEQLYRAQTILDGHPYHKE